MKNGNIVASTAIASVLALGSIVAFRMRAVLADGTPRLVPVPSLD
jgi:hypothetical protein